MSLYIQYALFFLFLRISLIFKFGSVSVSLIGSVTIYQLIGDNIGSHSLPNKGLNYYVSSFLLFGREDY